MALAIRALGRGDGTAAPDPAAVLRMVERVMTEGDARTGAIGCDLGPEDARALLRAWLDAVDLRMSERELLALLQSDGSRTPTSSAARGGTTSAGSSTPSRPRLRSGQIAAAASELFTACFRDPLRARHGVPRREKGKLATREGEPVRVALVADGIGGMHGVTHTIDEIASAACPASTSR